MPFGYLSIEDISLDFSNPKPDLRHTLERVLCEMKVDGTWKPFEFKPYDFNIVPLKLLEGKNRVKAVHEFSALFIWYNYEMNFRNTINVDSCYVSEPWFYGIFLRIKTRVKPKEFFTVWIWDFRFKSSWQWSISRLESLSKIKPASNHFVKGIQYFKKINY